jgi:CheY-like chemotaxis protein
VREYTETKVSFRITEGDEVVTRVTSEEGFNNRVKKAQENSAVPPELKKKQTFRIVEATSTSEALELCGGNEEIFLVHFNYGARLAQHNAANDLLVGDDFQPTEDVYDLAPVLSQKPEGRAKMSPEERAVRALAKGGINITAEQLKAALAALSGV